MEDKDSLMLEYINALNNDQDTGQIMDKYRKAGGSLVELYAAIVVKTAAKLSI